MYCTYPIEQLFFGFFSGAVLSWIGASFYFSPSKDDTESSTFTIPNIPGKSIAIFHTPNFCMSEIRDILEPYDEFYHKSDSEEEDKGAGVIPCGNTLKNEKYIAAKEKRKEYLCNKKQTLEDLAKLQHEQDSFIRLRKKTSIEKESALPQSQTLEKDHLKTQPEIVEEDFASNSDKALEKGTSSSASFSETRKGNYVTLGELESAHTNRRVRDTKMTKEDELFIINKFTNIIGMGSAEASSFLETEGYELHVLYKGTGAKTPAKAYSEKLIGVRVSSITEKVTEIIDVGGVDISNRGAINL